MRIRLASASGSILVEDDGTLVVSRREESVLVLRQAFVEHYGVVLPVVALVEARVDGGSLEATFSTSRSDMPSVHRLALDYVGRPSKAPPAELMARATWTTWARFKVYVTQAKVIEFADEIIAHDYPYSVFEIDDHGLSISRRAVA